MPSTFSSNSVEENVLLTATLEQLIADAKAVNPVYGEVLDQLYHDADKQKIFEMLGVQKSRGYDEIKAALALAKALFDKTPE